MRCSSRAFGRCRNSTCGRSSSLGRDRTMPPRRTTKRRHFPVLLHPRHWPSWAGIAVMRVISLLPLPVLWAGGVVVGELLYYLIRSRRQVVAINIGICFPQLSQREQQRLVRKHFHAFGQTVLDTGIAWWGRPARLRRLVRITGREHVDPVLAQGRNLILLIPHFVALEICGMRISLEGQGCAMFRHVKDPVLDGVMQKARTRFGLKLVPHNAPMTALVRQLRDGAPLFYLPDQDPHRRSREFVPFFGIKTATFTSLSRLAAMTNAVVAPLICRQLPRGAGYEVIVKPPLKDFPTADPVEDAAHMNREIEKEVRQTPAQYFWMHKRFKTRPPGEPKIY
ncbi:MAG: lysophospholipid acyltransferase family protein [Acidiferrobacterales bacterium]